MTRNHCTTSFRNSCVSVPVNPYSQQPSPSYERRRIVTSNIEAKGSNTREENPVSASSLGPSNFSGNATKHDNEPRGKADETCCTKKSPLDSFLDFYESIPDYQEVTHLSDSEFADKMKLLRERHRQYLHNLGGKYCARDYEEYPREDCDFGKKKSDRLMNKLQLAKEWVNKSCESLSSLGKKSDNDYQVREPDEDSQMKKSPSISPSPRKYFQYCVKDESETFLMDTGSSLSTDSNALKVMRESRSPRVMETERKHCTSSSTLREDEVSSTRASRMENNKGLINFYGMKECNARSLTSPTRKIRPSSYGIQSSGTSDLNTLDCVSPLGGTHNDISSFDYCYMPPGWLKSDSESAVGTVTGRRSQTQMSRSLPGSPVMKRVSGSDGTKCRSGSEKKKRKKKRSSRSKSPTKPVPFSFMRVDSRNLLSRSTPDLSVSHCRSPSPKLFRARPIPRNLFSNYIYQKRQEDEFFRALKRKVRAEGMLRGASLPPSMEFRERLSRVQAEAQCSGGSGGSHTSDAPSPGPRRRTRTRARRPPDFAKCHERMRQELSERQGRNITTSPSPYSLRTASLSPRRKDASSSSSSRCRPRSSLNMSSTSRSNLAALLRIQSARERLEAEHRRHREQLVRRAELRLKARLTRLTPAWRSIQYSTQEDLALRAAVRREEERARRQEHGMLMRHMLHRVHTIPTLFERQSGQTPLYPSYSRPGRALRLRVGDCGPSCNLDEEEAAGAYRFARRSSRPSSSQPQHRVGFEQAARAGRDGDDEEVEVEEEVEEEEEEGEAVRGEGRVASP